METLRKEGLPVNEDLERKANELEEEIIKKEILPVLSKTIEPALQPVQRELVLVVDYVPGNPLSVHLSRKRNFTAEIDAKEILPDPEVEHKEIGKTGPKEVKNPVTRLRITFADGQRYTGKKCGGKLCHICSESWSRTCPLIGIKAM